MSSCRKLQASTLLLDTASRGLVRLGLEIADKIAAYSERNVVQDCAIPLLGWRMVNLHGGD